MQSFLPDSAPSGNLRQLTPAGSQAVRCISPAFVSGESTSPGRRIGLDQQEVPSGSSSGSSAWRCLAGIGMPSSVRRSSRSIAGEPRSRCASRPPAPPARSCRTHPAISGSGPVRPTSLTLDASGQLAEQIKAGGPFDVFLAANQKFVATWPTQPGRPRVGPSLRPRYAGPLRQPVDRPPRFILLRDLSQPEIKKIAIANPDYAPYGMAARQALECAGALGQPGTQDRPCRVRSARRSSSSRAATPRSALVSQARSRTCRVSSRRHRRVNSMTP